VELKGTVSDYHPEWDTVTFSGQAQGTTTPDMNGNFDFFTGGLGLGTVTAVAVRFPGNQSAPVNALISDAPPSITSFSVVETGPGTWTFKGTVGDENPMGIVVQFGGVGQVIGKTATCDQYGNFSATYFIPNLTQGTITAQCQDVWGLLSNVAFDPIFPTN
jgi:hypothetical protein